MPTYDQQRREIERRRQIAQALMQQGMQPQDAQPAGRFLVGPTIASSAGRLAAALGGAALDKRVHREEQEAESAERERLADALRRMGGGPLGDGVPNAQQDAAREVFSGLPLEQQQQTVNEQALRTLFPPAPKYERGDLGDAVGVFDEGGNLVRRIQKGVSPDAEFREAGAQRRHDTPSGGAQLSAETTRRGQDLSAEVSMRGQDVTMRGQDLSAQVAREKFGAEQTQRQRADDAKRAGTLDAVNRTLGAVNDALELANWRTTGAIGALTRELPGGGAGTDAYSLAKTVDTVKANLSFQELQRMRDQSRTGGALGSITERELDLLGATVANLDPNQDDAQLVKQLTAVQQHLSNIKALNEAAGLAPGAPAGGSGDEEIDGLMSTYLQGGGGR